MSGQGTNSKWDTVDSEPDLDFIAGFPCNRFGCNGILRRAEDGDRPAIVCSTCEDVLYVLTGG